MMGHVPQRYERGHPATTLEITGKTSRRGPRSPLSDTEIFETLGFSYDTLAARLQELAFLNRGLRMLDDARTGRQQSLNMMRHRSFVEYLNRESGRCIQTPSIWPGERDGVRVEVALAIQRRYAEKTYSFANIFNTIEGART